MKGGSLHPLTNIHDAIRKPIALHHVDHGGGTHTETQVQFGQVRPASVSLVGYCEQVSIKLGDSAGFDRVVPSVVNPRGDLQPSATEGVAVYIVSVKARRRQKDADVVVTKLRSRSSA